MFRRNFIRTLCASVIGLPYLKNKEKDISDVAVIKFIWNGTYWDFKEIKLSNIKKGDIFRYYNSYENKYYVCKAIDNARTGEGKYEDENGTVTEYSFSENYWWVRSDLIYSYDRTNGYLDIKNMELV